MIPHVRVDISASVGSRCYVLNKFATHKIRVLCFLIARIRLTPCQSLKDAQVMKIPKLSRWMRYHVTSSGVLRLGNVVPDFSCDTTQGHWDSFHEWLGDSWGILFSHPADFTPVCTTELGSLALKNDWFKSKDVKVRYTL